MFLSLMRSRAAALLLLLASPGLTGLAIDAAHPCPAKSPWIVAHGAEHAGAHGAGEHHADTTHHEHAPAAGHDCRCVGACHTAMVVRATAAEPVLRLAIPSDTRSLLPAYTLLLPHRQPGELLPRATAPPLV